MTDGHMAPDGEGKSRIRVEHTAILDIGVGANVDQLVITAYHRIEPNAGARIHLDISDNICTGPPPKQTRPELGLG